MINQLIDIISREAHLFESFLELLERQKQMLVSNDVDSLKEVTELQREKITESRILNGEREKLVAAIKFENALEGDVTVGRLLELADDNQASRLTHLRDLIISLHQQIERTRNSNVLLLNQSREFIARTVAMLGQVNQPSSIYASSGRSADMHATALVDRKA